MVLYVNGPSGMYYEVFPSGETTAERHAHLIHEIAHRSRRGTHILLHSTNRDLSQLCLRQQWPNVVRHILTERHQGLSPGRVNQQGEPWRSVLQLFERGQMPAPSSGTEASLYTTAMTDGERTYYGAVLHAHHHLAVHAGSLTGSDLTLGELQAAAWAIADQPVASRLAIFTDTVRTRHIYQRYQDLLQAGDPHATSKAMTDIAKSIQRLHLEVNIANKSDFPALHRFARQAAIQPYLHGS